MKMKLTKFHCIIEHIGMDTAYEIVKNKLFKDFEVDLNEDISKFECKACIKAKLTNAPFLKKRSSEKATEYSQLVHSDL